MTGNIRKRITSKGVSYQLVLEKGIDARGKRQREYFTYPTKKEAEKAKSEKLDQLNKGTYIQPTKITIKNLLDEWVEVYVKPQLAPSTLRGYLVNINNHIIPYIGNILLQQLTPINVQEMYTKLEKKKLSPRSIKYVHTTLREALQYAFKMQMIPRNVCDFVSTPKQIKYKAQVYDQEEVKQLLTLCQNTNMEVPITLAVGIGLRRGEVLGLKWSDVDFKNGYLTVQTNLVSIKGKLIFSTPKTSAGNRTIAIPEYIIILLKKHKLEQSKNRFALGNSYNNHDLVCCKEDGNPINPSNFSQKFNRFLSKTNLKHIRFHDLRHTCATLMLTYGIPAKVASQRLGHSNISITLDTYSHVLNEVEQQVATTFDKKLFSKLG